MGMKELDSLDLPPLTVETLDEDGAENLKEAIVTNACREYVQAYRAYRMATSKKYRDFAHVWMQEVEQFFKSGWFHALSGEQVDGDKVLRKLRTDPPRKWMTKEEKEAIDEYIEKQCREDEERGETDISADMVSRQVRSGDFFGKMASLEYRTRRQREQRAKKDRYQHRGSGDGKLEQADGDQTEEEKRERKNHIVGAGEVERTEDSRGSFCSVVLGGKG